MNIVLIGYRGSGKSAVGRVLAEKLGWAFTDTDELTEQRSGMTIREIFADRAEEGFRELESQVIAEAAELGRHVISTGGGAILRAESVAALKRSGKLVWLTAMPVVLWKRIRADRPRLKTRPPRDAFDELNEVREVLAQRASVYAEVADVTVDTTDRPVDRVAEQIVQEIAVRWPHLL